MAIEQRREYRHRLLEMAQRRAKPGSGSSRATLLSRDWRDPGVDLRQLSVPYVIVGAVATSLYMPRRETRDLDILVGLEDSDRASEALKAAGFTKQGDLTIGGSTWVGPNGEEIDLIVSDEDWVPEALANPRLSPTGERVVALPYLVLLKMAASRPIDFGDLQRMLGQADDAALHEVRDVFRRFRPEDLEDLESFIVLGRLEFQ
jgi:hypothetical protein